MTNSFKRIAAVLAISAAAAASCSTGGASSPLDAGTALATLDGASSHAPYDAALDRLEAKCTNQRMFISDLAVTSKSVLREGGVRTTLLQVLNGMEESIPAELGRTDCTQIAAAWTALTLR